MAVVASVPGKLILMGEHAAVYGRPALVAAVGLRARVRVTAGEGPGVLLDLPALDRHERARWRELREYSRRARHAWEEYAADPDREGFRRVRGGDPAHVVKTALGELAEHRADAILPPLDLRVDSELPVGSGFGSSAAIAVGVLAAVSAFAGARESEQVLDRLALEVERRQHGMPSGVDHTAVLRGGVLQVQRGADDGLVFERLSAGPERLAGFAVFHTGEPAESTGEVVAAVRDRRRRDREAFERLLDRMEEDVRAFAAALGTPAPSDDTVRALIRDYESCLEEIGVVPESVRAAIRDLEQLGGAAKISGAGALSEPGAGCLLAFGAPERLPPAFERYSPYPVQLGVEGLRLEET